MPVPSTRFLPVLALAACTGEFPSETARSGEEVPPVRAIVVWGRPAADRGGSGYATQIRLAFEQEMAIRMGLPDPVFGTPTRWDDTTIPMGERWFWEDIGLVFEGEEPPVRDGLTPVLLTPTDALREAVDLQAAAERYASLDGPDVDPFLPLLVRWFQFDDNPMGMLNDSEIFQRWAAIYGIDLDALPWPERLQYSPHDGVDAFTRLDQEAFWDRDFSAASRVAWALASGGRDGAWPLVADTFAGDLEATAAVDVVAPGQLAAWLVEGGWADLEDAPHAMQARVRARSSEPWAFALVSQVTPFQVDLEVTLAGPAATLEVTVACDGVPVLTEPMDAPGVHELPSACGWDEARIHEVTVTASADGAPVARDEAIVTLVPGDVQVRRGDIASWGWPMEGPGDGRYSAQLTTLLLGYLSEEAGVGDAWFGDAFGSWDDGTFPMGERFVFDHVELISFDGVYPQPSGVDFAILRPTAALSSVADLGEAADRHDLIDESPTLSYSRAYLGTLLDWLLTEGRDADWIAPVPDLYAHWAATSGIDLDALPRPTAMQYSPTWQTTPHTDVASDDFWVRDFNCASITTWAIIWGMYRVQGDTVRSRFLDDFASTAAADAVIQGQVPAWLHTAGLAEVVHANSRWDAGDR